MCVSRAEPGIGKSRPTAALLKRVDEIGPSQGIGSAAHNRSMTVLLDHSNETQAEDQVVSTVSSHRRCPLVSAVLDNDHNSASPSASHSVIGNI